MPGITDPSQEYFKDGLWAWVTDQWKKLVADASNFLQVNIAAQDIDVEVKQTTAADLTPGCMGWDGSVWRKLGMLWGIDDTASETVTNLSAGAGLNNLVGTAVPAGEVWIIEHLSIINVNSATTLIHFHALVDSSDVRLFRRATIGANEWVTFDSRVVLAVGDKVYADIAGCTAGDDLHFRYCGYKMKVAE